MAIISRLPGVETRTHLGPEPLDASGRWIETDFDIDGETVTIVSAYVHSGEVDTPKQDAKWLFLDAMERRLASSSSSRPSASWHWWWATSMSVTASSTSRTGGATARTRASSPVSRAYFDRFFGPEGEQVEGVDGSTGAGLGWIDVGRRAVGEVDGPYTFWSMRGKAFDTDSGWRIDYHVATPALAERVTSYSVERAPRTTLAGATTPPSSSTTRSGPEAGRGGRPSASLPVHLGARIPGERPAPDA